MTDTDTITAAERLDSAIHRLGLSIDARQVPWSQSRHKDAARPSIEWDVRVLHQGRDILKCQYSQGVAHLPFDVPYRQTVDGAERVRVAVETGRDPKTGKRIRAPKARDVLASLALDAGVIDYAKFEDWASDFGLDPDSRRGERAYRECMETALSLRAAIGDDGLQALRDAAADY